MTQVISRTFETETKARMVARELLSEGMAHRAIRIVTAKPGENAKDLTIRLASYDLAVDTAKTYSKHITANKHAAVVVHATHTPLGAARLTRSVLDNADPVNVGDLVQEVRVPDVPGSGLLSILDSHPHFLTTPVYKRRPSHGLISKGIGPKLLLKRKPRTSAIRGGAHMSRYFWPMRLATTKPRRNKVISGGGLLSRVIGLPTLSARR